MLVGEAIPTEFFLPSSLPSKPIITKASQLASPIASKSTGTTPSVSLADIELLEEEFAARKDKSDHDNGRWDIERRERAESLVEIQGKEQGEQASGK